MGEDKKVKRLVFITLILFLTGCTPEYVQLPPVTETITPAPVTITAPPETVYVDVERTITPPPITITETVNQTVEVMVFTDNISEWFIPWKSQDEVRQYYKSVQVDMVEAMANDNHRWDCDDWAMWLSHRALLDRREIGLMAIIQGTQGHLMNFVIIGNRIYKLEPQNGNLNPPAGYDYTVD